MSRMATRMMLPANPTLGSQEWLRKSMTGSYSSSVRAVAQDVEALPETTWIVPGRRGTQLRFDDNEIALRTRRQTRWIAWDDVRWFRDGKYFHLSRRLRNDGWALAIALKD